MSVTNYYNQLIRVTVSKLGLYR